MLSAQARGHRLWHYDVGSLTLDENGRLTALAAPVRGAARGRRSLRTRAKPRRLDLGRDIDVVLMRQDPPFDMGYITATHLLERLAGETLVVNDPRERAQRARKGVRARLRAASCRRRWSPAALDEVRAFSAATARWWSSRSTATAARRSSACPRAATTSSALIERVQPDLARAAHGPAVPPRGRRRRQAHRAGRRRVRRRDQPQAGGGRVPLEPRAGRLCRGDRR